MQAVKSIIKKKPSVEDIVVKGKKQVKKRVNSTFGFTLTDVYALLKSCLTQTLTDEEIYELARTINDKDVIIAELEEQLKESHKKSSDLESDLKTVTEMLSQNWRIIQWKEETNSFLQIRLNELNNKHSKILDKYHEIDNNLNQERIKRHETSQQLLDQKAKNQQLANEIATLKNNYHQLSTENNEKQAKLETVKNNLNKLKLFYDLLNKEYRANLTNWNVLVQNHNSVVSELNWVKEQRPNITLAEYNKITAKNLQAKNFIKKIKKGKNIVCQLLKERKDELQQKSHDISQLNIKVNDLTTNLTNITNQRDLLQTEKDNLNVSYQNLQNDYTNLETTSNNLQIENNNLQVELQNKNNEVNSRRENLRLKDEEITDLKTKLESKEKEIIQEINNSLNLNLSEPTLSFIISHLKKLITPLPAFTDDICIRDLEIIKKVDLIEIEKFLGIQLSEKEKHQFQSTTHYQELVNFRHFFLKQYLAQNSITTPSPTIDKQLSKKENVLSVLLIMSLLIIFLQFIWMKKRPKRRVLVNIR